MVKPAEANVVGPAVAADQPDRFLNQRIGIRQQLFRTLNALQRVAQFSDLLAPHVRRGFRVKSLIQFCRDFIGKLLQQTHHARAVLVDGQTEAKTKLGVIFKQRVCPCRAATVSVGSVWRGREVTTVNRRTAGGVSDQHSVAVELRKQFDIRCFSAARAGTRVFEQRSNQL